MSSGRRLLDTSLKCIQCPSGRFKAVVGNHDCDECYCPVSHFASKICQPSQNHNCSGICRSKCDDHQFQVDSCRTTSDLQCRNCRACAPNQYVTQPCTKHQDTQCANCTVCAANEYAQQACTVDSNTVCQSCTTCLSHEYQDQACTATADTQCLSCLSCENDEYIQSACTNTTNTDCAACTTCGGNQYASTLCSDNQNAVCSTCDSCESGKYIRQACTPVSNTLCNDCRQCPPGETPIPGTQCTGSQNTECQVCAAGKYKDSHSTNTCDDCASGYTSPEGSTKQTDCVVNAQFESSNACSFFGGSCQCKAGYYGHVPFCTPCVAGKYQPSIGPDVCLNCPAGTYSTTQGATSDTVCQSCGGVSNADSSSTSSGSTSCACNRGYLWDMASGTCAACAIGTYMPVGDSQCQVCKQWD